jgi:hypothetical protein
LQEKLNPGGNFGKHNKANKSIANDLLNTCTALIRQHIINYDGREVECAGSGFILLLNNMAGR